MLTKDHQHPFIKITKGEYLQALEAAVARMYETEKQKIARDNKGNQKSIDYFTGYLNTNHEKRMAVLRSNKDKYQDPPAGDGRDLDDRTGRAARELSRCVRR